MDTDATRARPPPRAAADADAEDGEVVMAEGDGAAANALDDGDGDDGDDDEPELDLDALRRAALANMHGFAGGGDAPPRASPSPAAPSSAPFAPARANPNRPAPRAFEPSSLEERAARFAADEVSDDDDDALARADDISGSAAPRPAGTHIVGVCELMCPPSERQLRERKNDIELFERVDAENRCKSSSALCVKKYTRIVDGVTPEMVRTRAALDRTVTHLYGLLDDRPEASFMSKSKFLWDRLRSVRQDLSLQAIADSFAARLLEQMARFAILSEHELCEETATVTNPDGHNSHLNIEQLAKTLTSLRHMYKDRRRGLAGGAVDSASGERRDDLDAEAEMFAYQLLLRIDSHGRYAVERREMLNDLRGARAEVLTHPDVQLALEANRAYGDGNVVAFFRAVDRATYLQACVLHKYFARVRSKALETMNATYGKQTMSVNELAKHLRCDADEAEALAAHHGLAVVTKERGAAGAAAGGRGRGAGGGGAGAGGRRFVALRDAGFVEPAEEFPIARSSLVDAKRHGAFIAEIVGERRRPTPGSFSPAGAVQTRAGGASDSSPLRASAAAFTPAREAQAQVRARSAAPPPASPSPSKAAEMEALRAKIAATEAAEKKRKERKRAAPAEASREAPPPGPVSPVSPADGTPSKEAYTPESEPTHSTAPESRVRRSRPKEPSPKEGAAEEAARRGDAPPFPSAPVGFTAAPLPATAEGNKKPPRSHFGGFAPTPALVRGSAANPSSEDEASKAAAARSLAAAEATARADADAERVAAARRAAAALEEAEAATEAAARAAARAKADADAKAKAEAEAAEAERLRVEAERLAAERARERRALAAAREREAKRLRRAAKSRAARLALHFARWLANARLLASARLREARLESSRAAASPALAPVPPKLTTSRARAAAGFLSPETSIRRARLAVDAARRRAWGAPIDVSKIARGAASFAADAGGSAGGCPRAWKLVADCRRREGAPERARDAASAWLVAKLSRGGAPEPAPGERGRVLSLYADEGKLEPDGSVHPDDGVTPDAISPDGFTPDGFTPSSHPRSSSEPMWVCVREVEVDAGPGEDPVPRRDRREGFRGASAGVCALSVSASDADSGGLAWDRSGGALPASEARRVRRFVAALGRGDLTATRDRRAPPPPALFLLAGPASAVGGGGGARAAALVAALVAAEDGDATRAVRVETIETPDEEDETSAAYADDEKEKENVADAAFARAGAWDAALERGLRWAARAAPPRRAARLARLRDVVADALVFSSAAPPPSGSESFPSSSSLDDPAACVRAFDAAVAEARRVVRGGAFSFSFPFSRGGRSADEEGEGARTPGGLASEFAALASASEARRATGRDADAVAARDALLARARLGASDDDADDAPPGSSSGFVRRALGDSFIGRSDATTTDEPSRRKRGVVLRASFRRVFAERLAALDAAETASGLALARVFVDGGGEGGGGSGGGGIGSDAVFFGTRGPASVAAWGAREDEDARRAERKRRRRDGDADADEGRALATGAGADPGDTTTGTPRGHFGDPPDTTPASISPPARPSRAALAPVGSSPPSRETAPLRVAAKAADELDDWLARAALTGAETDENAPALFTLETEAWADDGDVVAKLRKIGEGRVRL